MVKTRHSVDVDAETPPKFISLNNERNRLSTRNSATGDNNQLSHAYGNHGHDYNIFEDKVVETRLRPRTGPSRAYNYLDADSSDEDSLVRHRQHSGVASRQIKSEMLNKHESSIKGSLRCRKIPFHEEADQSIEEENGTDTGQHRIRTRHQIDSVQSKENRKNGNAIHTKRFTRRSHQSEDEDDEEDNVHESKRSETRRHASDDEDDGDNIIRRSSRTRRQVYDTLNQSYLVSIPGQKKQPTDDHSDTKEQDESEDNEEFSDMYSRVKRKRVRVKRNMYGIPVNDDSDSSPDVQKGNKNNNKLEDDFESDSQEDAEEGMEKEADVNNCSRRVTRGQNVSDKKKQPPIVKSYSLREHKPRTVLYKAPLEERRVKKIAHSIFQLTPTKKSTNQAYHSPAQLRNIRKRSAFHSSSSSTSSSGGESSDEKSFKRRKAKSMSKARNRMMPLNTSSNALPSSSVIKDRIRSGCSLADVEPMYIDRNITFSSIGGLGKHIRALKEMVVFPLLYNQVFQRFNVDPPRGVLFYGPPGTGKTLVARALANECSTGDKRVAFFMRKGADCLSKWVGESERQLRILFDQAYKFRPSIIFFDEIDGLAPVRSSRQDQIHSSIVSTLLALMDGLDSRGEIVVIGATNRIDSIDPALRRPGRFDREFFFPLPSFEARKQILKIHTDSWNPKLNEHFISELAEKCVGYCGADIKSLCTEAAILAFRRRYPQIYMTNEALQIDASSIHISARDFFDATNNIIPTSQRSVSAPGRALIPRVQPLLQRKLDDTINVLKDIFPPCLTLPSVLDTEVVPSQEQLLGENSAIWDDLLSDEDDNCPSIFISSVSSKGKALKKNTDGNIPSTSGTQYLNFMRPATRCPSIFRPRLILAGSPGQGQTTYIAPALIHKMENLPVHVLDLPALYAVTTKTPEESCANVFLEAKRKCPSIIYLPYINEWWDVMADTLKATLLTLIHDLNPSLPLLLLATSEQPYEELNAGIKILFSQDSGEVIEMCDPNVDERKLFFKELLIEQACQPPPQKKKSAQRMLEILPKAAPPKSKELTKQELEQLEEKEEITLMELRIFLRDVLNKLGSDKKFSIFAKPVNIENAPDYYEIIENPMDLSTMMAKIDLHEYGTVRAFMNDIDLICSNALEYNPNRGPMDRIIRHRACAMKDTAYAIIKTELDKEFEKTCVEIEESRKRRGHKSTTVPNFYYTKPQSQSMVTSRPPTANSVYFENSKLTRSIPKPEGERFSRRVRGLNIDPVPPLEAVEKVFKLSRVSAPLSADDVQKDCKEMTNCSDQAKSQENLQGCVDKPATPGFSKEEKVSGSNEASKELKTLSPPSNPIKLKKKVDIWCKPKRKRPKFAFKKEQNQAEDKMDVDLPEKSATESYSESLSGSSQNITQQLKIDIAETATIESKEEKSLTSGKSSNRPKSCQTSPNRIITRRSSMSPTIYTPKISEPSSSSQQEGLDKNISQPNDQTKQTEDKVISQTAPETSKPSAVKRLDLESVLDSGVGSSIDSNGDSRDSIEHSKTEISSKQSLVAEHDKNQNYNTEPSNSVISLTEPKREVTIDKQALENLCVVLATNTHGYCVERLEKIYSQLSQIIYNHRSDYDRTDMIKELRAKVEQLTNRHWGPSSSSLT